MKTFKVDLDYESYLFDPFYKENSPLSIKVIKEFEYVFFLINKEDVHLQNVKKYSEKYLQHLKDLGFIIPDFVLDYKDVIYWWGNRHDKEIEKKLNSKLTSSHLALENNWGFFDGAIVENLEDVNKLISKLSFENFILKSPYSFSGIGNIIFDRHFLPLVQFRHPMLLEPIYNRVFDLGVTFEIVDSKIENMFIVENFNNKQGSFKGGMGASDLKVFINIIKNKYQFDLSPFLDTYKKICETYLKLGAKSNIQIDSFVFKNTNDEMQLYPLVEVNYRKTMGLVIQSLANHSSTGIAEWRVTHTNEYENSLEWIRLSPEDNKLNSYYRELSEDFV
jgi:hypothetical protein